VPKGKDFDAAGFSVDLVVEVIVGSAEEEAPDALSLDVAGSRSDSGLGGNKLECPLKVVHERERSRRSVGSPPGGRPPDLLGGPGSDPDRKASDQGLPAKLSKESVCVDELPRRRLLQGLFEGSLLLGR
jgi:hypothetical protein